MKYRDLVPNVDKYQEGDEYEIVVGKYIKISVRNFGYLCKPIDPRARRPIPDSTEEKEKEVNEYEKLLENIEAKRDVAYEEAKDRKLEADWLDWMAVQLRAAIKQDQSKAQS
jgi:hypothetical protein